MTLDPAPQDSSQHTFDGNASVRISQTVERMAPTLRRVAWALLRDWQLADDATQEAFMLFTQRIDEIDTDMQDGWLVKTVQLKALTLRRSVYRQQKLIGKLREAGTEARTTSDAQSLSDTETTSKLKVAISQLPDKQRQVVLLRLQGEQTFAEIAEKLGKPLSTVLSRMRLALEKLTKRLNQDDQTPSP